MNDFYDDDIIERGKRPVPTADEETKEAPRRGRPKGARNKPKANTTRQLGEKQVSARVSDACYEQLRILAIKQRTTVQGLLVEAMDMLFKRYDLPQIAGEADSEDASVLQRD